MTHRPSVVLVAEVKRRRRNRRQRRHLPTAILGPMGLKVIARAMVDARHGTGSATAQSRISSCSTHNTQKQRTDSGSHSTHVIQGSMDAPHAQPLQTGFAILIFMFASRLLRRWCIYFTCALMGVAAVHSEMLCHFNVAFTIFLGVAVDVSGNACLRLQQ
mmetsp:Transcript_70998/g.136977  ORF Transcript_70998/g.136977 Transcript_70998/m.136977 type:complete len:160 (-) Transcript_70998:34-513(-)